MPFSLIAQVVCDPAISAATNRISESGYSYDANGSLTANAAGERFGYDGESHQTEFFAASNQGSTPDAVYTYDGEGRRVKKVSAAETTIFVYDASGVLIAEYSGEVASEPRVSYLTTDHLGSPRVVTDERGSVTSRRDFTAFGEESFTAQRTQGLGYQRTEVRQNYTGYEKDAETGLEFAQARYYNPAHGRFTSVDPLTASASIRDPQTFNRYSYGLNSPYKFTDPLGLLSEYTTGACGNRCPNSASRWAQAGGSMISAFTGMGELWVETVWDPFAGGVQLAPNLTKDQVKGIIDAFEDLYKTEEGYAFFQSFFDESNNSTLILTAEDLSSKDTNGKTTMGLTSVVKSEAGHMTTTITLDLARIDKAVTVKAIEDAKNKDRIVGVVAVEGVKTRQDVAKHEISHALHAKENYADYVRQVGAGTSERAVTAYEGRKGWDKKATNFPKGKASDLFKSMIKYSEYTFRNK
ncbi:MAG TPA: RHS repeat-associated core domain-containing protein [Pyrinomonadaceae bacterium]|nr:RHS repeat-associated core domain-containing protein [Pyrinomonadaceae bacterium]